MDLHAIILAAGKGKRMQCEKPKCAVEFLGIPMVQRIVNTCTKSGINDICVVIGHKKDYIKEILKDSVNYVEQEKQYGTADAVKCCKEYFSGKSGMCILFPGDMPLINPEIVTEVINQHINNNNSLTVVTTQVDNPTGYGRIYRENGKIKKIIEEKDASFQQKMINEVNTGLYCCDINILFQAIDSVANNNNSNEYYLTDIVEIIGKNYKVESFIVQDSRYVIGINDLDTLRKYEEELNN